MSGTRACSPPEPAPNAGCPRCGGAFRCGIGDPVACPCAGVALDAATLAGLRSAYAGCLCLACLRALAAGQGTPVASATESPEERAR